MRHKKVIFSFFYLFLFLFSAVIFTSCGNENNIITPDLTNQTNSQQIQLDSSTYGHGYTGGNSRIVEDESDGVVPTNPFIHGEFWEYVRVDTPNEDGTYYEERRIYRTALYPGLIPWYDYATIWEQNFTIPPSVRTEGANTVTVINNSMHCEILWANAQHTELSEKWKVQTPGGATLMISNQFYIPASGGHYSWWVISTNGPVLPNGGNVWFRMVNSVGFN